MANDDDDDLIGTVSGMADRLKLSGKERQTYIHEHMTRSGYRMEPTYVPGGDDDDDDDRSAGGFFSSGSRSSSRNRSRSSSRNRGRTRDDDDW